MPVLPLSRFSLWLSAGRLAWGVVALGVLLRVAIWWQARSVYLDEVALLRNFVERSYGQLFQPLDYEQYSPPFFSVLMKATVQLLGNSELAIRLVPLLASCAMLVLLRGLALRWLPGAWAVLAVAFPAFSSVFLDFATVCKQYSTDALVAVALLALADRQVRQPAFSGRAALGWATLGAGAVWASMPATFVLAGVGLALAWTYRAGLLGVAGGRLVVVGACWLVSFLVYFKLLLQADAQSDYLQNFHRDAFLPFPPHSAAELARLGTLLQGLADKAFGKTVLAIALAAVGVLAGTWQQLRQPSARTWLLLVPLVACLAASALHYYSLLPRLMLFALPIMLLLLLGGLHGLAAGRRWPEWVLLALVVMVLLNQQRLKHLVVPFQADYADVRGGFAYVAAHQQPGEVLFVYHNERQPAYYYQHLYPSVPLRNPYLETYRDTPQNDVVQQDVLALAATGRHRIWLVYDRPDKWLYDWAAQHGTVSQFAALYEGYAFLVDIAPNTPAPAAPAW